MLAETTLSYSHSESDRRHNLKVHITLVVPNSRQRRYRNSTERKLEALATQLFASYYINLIETSQLSIHSTENPDRLDPSLMIHVLPVGLSLTPVNALVSQPKTLPRLPTIGNRFSVVRTRPNLFSKTTECEICKIQVESRHANRCKEQMI